MSRNTEALIALSKALRPAIVELVSDYQGVVKALEREARRSLDRPTLRQLRGMQARRHYELGVLVPCVRHLRVHLQQIRAGFGRTPIEETAAPLAAVLLGFAVASDPLSEYHPMWAVPLDARLVSALSLQLMGLRHLEPAKMWMAEDPELLMFQALEGSNLGELRQSYLTYTKLVEAEEAEKSNAAALSRNEKLKAFLAVRDRLRTLLTPEDYILLREFSDRL